MNAEQFENLLKSVKDMNEEQHNELVHALKQHVIIPNHWTKMHIEKIAKKSIDEESFEEFCGMVNYGMEDDEFDVHTDLNDSINTFFELGHDDKWIDERHEGNASDNDNKDDIPAEISYFQWYIKRRHEGNASDNEEDSDNSE